jgi:hypothetical protein
MERVETMGEWAVIEYEPSTGRRIKQWSFPSFTDAQLFRRKRVELYRTIGFEKKRHFTPALPTISAAEMDLFERIIQNPEWMRRIMNRFVG